MPTSSASGSAQSIDHPTLTRGHQVAQGLLLLLLLASFGLRIYRLGDKSIWWDEGLAAWSARQSLPEIARWTASDVHPPLYFWLLHFWRLLSGDSEFGLRLLSAMIGVLGVAATYLLGRQSGRRQTGLLAALLMTFSRFDVWWSQEARMYILAALWAALALWAAIRFWDGHRPRDGALYVLFATAGLYTLYLSISVMVVANLIWLWVWWRAQHRSRLLWPWAVAQVVVLLLYSPWLIYALGRIPTWSSASTVAVDVFLRIYWTVLTTGIPVNVESHLWLTLPVLAIFVLGLIRLLWQGRRNWRTARNAGLFLLSLLLPAAVVYVVSLPKKAFFYSPQLAPRYLLIFAPAFYTLLAWGLDTLAQGRRHFLGTAATALVVAAEIYGLWSFYPGRVLLDDYKSLQATLRAYQHPGDAVVLYTDRDWPIFAYHHPGPWWGVPYAQPMTPEFTAAYLEPIWQAHEGIWLVITPYAGVNDPQGILPAWLAERAIRTVEHRQADNVLRLYARTEARAATAQSLAPGAEPAHLIDSPVAAGLRLIGYDQPVRAYHNGDTVHLFLYWQLDERAQTSTTLQVSLIDPQDRIGKQVSIAAPQAQAGENLVRQQVDLVVPPDATGGLYGWLIDTLPTNEPLRFGRVRVWARARASLTTAEVSIGQPLLTDLADGVRLLGFDLAQKSVAPGDTLHLTLYWQAREAVGHRYKVFTHLLGQVFNATSGNFLWGQQDNEPVAGTRATTTWRSGEVIIDSYAIRVLPEAPPGPYEIEIGLYDPATGQRLPVLDAQGQKVADHIVISQVTVETNK
ncbi:MAG: glycosyltransferase family 39 protein [Chloroflexota bacterium]